MNCLRRNVLTGADGVRGDLVAVRATGQTATVHNFNVDGLLASHVRAGDNWIRAHRMCKADDAVELIYESDPKHGPDSYNGHRGEVSRAPRGDAQAMLDNSTLVKTQLRHGVEPDTGLRAGFRRHREFEGTEWWLGFVPGG